MTGDRPKRTRLRAGGKPRGAQLSGEARAALEEALSHVFKDRDLLDAAMTHPSALKGENVARYSYQRLEFLGDRVLALHMAERLFERRPKEREGSLAPRFNQLVNKSACATAARHAGLGPHILLGPSERSGGGAEKDNILGDVCEAVIGALYLDGGMKPASRFIEWAWTPVFEGLSGRTKHPKTLLQEWAQDHGLPLPDYDVVARDGPDHAPMFTVRAVVEGFDAVIRSGPSKSDAEAEAAEALLEIAEASDG
ncbi:MAG: ribonuclease III [Pseudomonadota bacterium]